jgi:N-acetylneuraminate synthase
MAERAAESGAWAIKFQLYKAERLATRESPKYWRDDFGTTSQYEAFKKSDQMSYQDWGAVAEVCRAVGIVFFATPFDNLAVDALEEIDTPLYKIASADITNRSLLEYVASTQKPLLLSTGASTREEIERAIEWTGLDETKLVLLVCTLKYPTEDADGNFARIESFRRRFDPLLIGYSDHTLGTAGAWMTAALGGVAIEKHYTLDKALPDVPDHAMSVDPDELREMALACARGAELRGSDKIGVAEAEQSARLLARRSVVLDRGLSAGTVLTHEDLALKRPGTGIEPYELSAVVGARLLFDYPKDHVLQWSDVEMP